MSEAMAEARDVTLLDLVDRAIDHGVILDSRGPFVPG